MNTNNNGIIALTIGNTNPFIVDAQLSKDAILEVSKTEQFIPIQQIVNKKVKLLLTTIEEAGNFIIYNQNNSRRKRTLITKNRVILQLAVKLF
jgi:hypothetical protein